MANAPNVIEIAGRTITMQCWAIARQLAGAYDGSTYDLKPVHRLALAVQAGFDFAQRQDDTSAFLSNKARELDAMADELRERSRKTT